MGDQASVRHEIPEIASLRERIEATRRLHEHPATDPLQRLRLIQERLELESALEYAERPVEWSEPQLPNCCQVCGGAIEQPAGAGRPRSTCGDPCRAKLSRRRRKQWAATSGR